MLKASVPFLKLRIEIDCSRKEQSNDELGAKRGNELLVGSRKKRKKPLKSGALDTT